MDGSENMQTPSGVMKTIRLISAIFFGLVALGGLLLSISGEFDLLTDPTLSNPAFDGGLAIIILITVGTAVLSFKLAAPFLPRRSTRGMGFEVRTRRSKESS